MSDNTFLVVLTAASIGLVILLVARWKMNAFIALLVASMLMGIAAVTRGISGTPAGGAAKPLAMLDVLEMFQTGMGKTLGAIGAILVLGAILGKLFGESGGAEVLAKKFAAILGPKNVHWLIPILALIIGLTTWFVVGLLLLLPILLTLTRETKRPFLLLALPLLSFLSVMHGLMPPHPGPVIALAKLHGDAGKLLLWGFLIGIPVAAIAGPLFARIAIKRVTVNPPAFAPILQENQRLPGFGVTLITILIPIVLLLAGTVAELAHMDSPAIHAVIHFVGNPTIALLIAVLVAFYTLGVRCGHTPAQLLRITEQSVASIAMPVIVVGAGAGFGRVITDMGVARILGDIAAHGHLSPIVYGWLAAAFIRVATGSATVAITIASELIAPVLASATGVNTELVIISIGCGSLFLSHLNDGGFWVVKECLGLTVGETLRTWTITETLIGVCGLGLCILAQRACTYWAL